MKASIFQVFILLMLALGVEAEELRLVDQNGLIRALKVDARPSRIEVRLLSGDARTDYSSISLSRVDGINPSIPGNAVNGDARSEAASQIDIAFENVPPGIWRVEVWPNNIIEAHITDTHNHVSQGASAVANLPLNSPSLGADGSTRDRSTGLALKSEDVVKASLTPDSSLSQGAK